MRILALAAVVAALSAGARAQPSLSDLPPLPEVQPKKEANPEGLVHVAAGTSWREWLRRHYPSRASSWPEGASKSFKELESEEKWDFVGQGDYDADGTPTSMLIRFAAGKKGESGVVARFALAKWRDGKWAKLVDFDSVKGAKLNGAADEDLNGQDGYLLDLVLGNAKRTAHPGMSIFVELANRNGQGMSDSAQLYFVPKDRKYVIGGE